MKTNLSHLALVCGLLVAAAPSQSARAADVARASAISAAEFVRRAALSGMFETKSSEMAAVKADEPTRAFAAMMNADHQKISSELGVIVKRHASDLPLPARLDPSAQREVDALEKLDGIAFTQQYRSAQVKTPMGVRGCPLASAIAKSARNADLERDGFVQRVPLAGVDQMDQLGRQLRGGGAPKPCRTLIQTAVMRAPRPSRWSANPP